MIDRDEPRVSDLYLLEPAEPGAAWAPFAGVRPIAELRAGVWRVRERWEAACDREASAILGAHVDGFHEADEPRVRPVGADRRPRDRGRRRHSRRPAIACRLPEARGGCSIGASPSAGSWRAGERWNGPHDAGRRGRDRRAAAPGRVRPRHRARAVSRRGLRRLAGGALDRRARGQPRARRPGRRHRARRGRRARRGLRRAPGRRRARARRRGAARHPARGPALRRPEQQAARRASSARRCSARNAACTARSRPVCFSATPTRVTTGSWGTAWSGTG